MKEDKPRTKKANKRQMMCVQVLQVYCGGCGSEVQQVIHQDQEIGGSIGGSIGDLIPGSLDTCRSVWARY